MELGFLLVGFMLVRIGKNLLNRYRQRPRKEFLWGGSLCILIGFVLNTVVALAYITRMLAK